MEASDATRQRRGYVFTEGVDDAASECGLDSYKFEIVISNNGDQMQLEESLNDLVEKIKARCRAA